MPPFVPTAAPQTPQSRWGRASRHDFDNPAKWETVPDIPVLDEHELTNEAGQETGYVDRRVLEQIAANNNRRVTETGDPAPLIIGHTSDDPNAPERPVVGYAVNYRVKPFRRNPDGSTKYAIFTDYKLRPKYAHAAEDYPRRSVELWIGKRELDPIALLGGTTPERDLGVVIRRSRIKAVAILGGTTPRRDLGVSLHYSRRSGSVLRYAMEDDMPRACPPDKMNYAAEDMADDDLDTDDEGAGGPPGAGEGDDPVVDKVLSSKKFISAIKAAVTEAIDAAIGGGDEFPGDGMDDGMGGAPGGMPPGAGAAPPPPGPPGAGGPPGGMPPEEDEMRLGHGDRPVKFNYGATGFPGPGATTVPNVTSGNRYSRNGARPTPSGTGSRPMARQQTDNEVVRLRRQVGDMALRLARADAEKLVTSLKAEGIVFGATPEEAQRGEADDIEFLARLGEADRQHYVNNTIRAKYARRQDPANPAYPGVARYAAPGVVGSGTDGGEFALDDMGASPQEAVAYADAVAAGRKPEDVIKLMRQARQGNRRRA